MAAKARKPIVAAQLYTLRDFMKTPEDMAKATGESVESYLSYENGQQDFPFGFLYHCAETLDVDIVEILTGENPHLSGYNLVLIMAGGLVLRGAIGPAEHVLNMMGRQRVCAAIYCGALVVNLLLCMTFITDFGATGAAAATTASIALETVLLHFAVGKLIG